MIINVMSLENYRCFLPSEGPYGQRLPSIVATVSQFLHSCNTTKYFKKKIYKLNSTLILLTLSSASWALLEKETNQVCTEWCLDDITTPQQFSG